MVWDKRVRSISWVVFVLMWIPLVFMIYTAVTDGDAESIGIAMVLFFLLCILFGLLLFGSFTVGRLEKENIKKRGVPARATIVSVSDTGTTINDQPLVRIGLEVQPPYAAKRDEGPPG